jgi:hypothetical protein
MSQLASVSDGGFVAASRRSIASEGNVRLDGVGQSVQHILNLARLRPQLVQRTRIIRGVVIPPRIAEWALVAKVVAGGAADLRHGGGVR